MMGGCCLNRIVAGGDKFLIYGWLYNIRGLCCRCWLFVVVWLCGGVVICDGCRI